MFTKLFDGRSLPVLARAIFLAIGAAVAMLWLPPAEGLDTAEITWGATLPRPWLAGMWAVSIPLLALLLNEMYHRYQLIANNYQLAVVLTLLLSACFKVMQAAEVALALGFGAWFFALMLRSYRRDNARFSAFDMGMLAGLGFVLNPGLLVLLLLSALYILLIGNGRIKVFLALILGFGAVGFLAFSVLELSGFHQMALRIPAGLTGYKPVYEWAPFSPVFLVGSALVTLLALLTFLGSSAAMTVYERVLFSSFSLWVLLLWALSFIFNYPITLFTLPLLFSALMQVFLLLKLHNRWLRDGVYLVLLLLYAWPWYLALA